MGAPLSHPAEVVGQGLAVLAVGVVGLDTGALHEVRLSRHHVGQPGVRRKGASQSRPYRAQAYQAQASQAQASTAALSG